MSMNLYASGQPTLATEVSESANGHDGGKPDMTNYDENHRHVSNPDLTTASSGPSAAPTPKAGTTEPTSVDLSTSVREEEVDPFSYRPRLTKWDYIKISINALWLLPLRLFFVVIPSVTVGFFACILAIICDKYDEANLHPLNRWGRFMLGYVGPFISRIFLLGFGFNWIHKRGELAPTKEAPILVVSPHSSLLDIFIMLTYSKCPAFLARSGVKNVPLFGPLIPRTFRTVFVRRGDPDSKMEAAEEIRRRTQSREEWPKMLIFPEGTTTNTKVLISFKQGAFLPKLPVQPVIIKYNNKLNTTTWGEDGKGLLRSVFLTLCQFHNSLEVEFLPVYRPTEQEAATPKLYARNVQIHMAKAVGLLHTQHSFEDVLLMREARKAGLPFHSGMVIYIKASHDLNMGFRAMKKWLHRFIAMDRDQDGFVKIEDFAKFLQMPAEDVGVRTVFRDAELEAGEERLSFRGYLYGVVGKARPLLQDASFMQSLFSFFDSNVDGVVSEADLSRHLPFKSFPFVADTAERVQDGEVADSSHRRGDEGSVSEEMNLEQFSSLLDSHPEYVLIFHKHISSQYHTSLTCNTDGCLLQDSATQSHSRRPKPEDTRNELLTLRDDDSHVTQGLASVEAIQVP